MMKARAMVAIVLLAGLLLGADPAFAGQGGAKGARALAESSLRVSGTITVGKDGNVLAHTLDPKAPLGEPLATFVNKVVAGWRFEPVRVDGEVVNAKVPMHLRLVARRADDDKVSVAITSAYFGSDDEVPKTDNPASIKLSPPQYPGGALRMGGQGTVYLIVQIGRDGKVTNADAEQVNLRVAGTANQMKSLRDQFTIAAVRAARGWKFTVPTTGESAGDDTWLMRIPVDFVLGRGSDRDREANWDTYIPGPRNMGMPWAQEKLKTAGSPDALPDTGIYPLRQGATLLSPLG